MAETPYFLNQDEATAKVMGDEAVVINVATGRYYSMDAASCIAWMALSGGGTVDDAVTGVIERYDGEAEQVRTDVALLLEELLAEHLVVPAPSAGGFALPPVAEPRPAYEGIYLQKFRDMEELLAFDPPLPRTADPASRPPEW